MLLGKGDGTFQNLITLGAEGYGIAVGDFNGDGSPDLAVGAVTVLLDRLAHRAHTTTKLVSSANPSNAAETVTFMATVTSLGKTSPTGKVAFTINGNKPFSVSLTKGQAKLNWTFGTAGERNVVASYSGDKTNAPSTAPTLRQLVNPR